MSDCITWVALDTSKKKHAVADIREGRQEAFTTENGHAGTAPDNRCNPRISE